MMHLFAFCFIVIYIFIFIIFYHLIDDFFHYPLMHIRKLEIINSVICIQAFILHRFEIFTHFGTVLS